MHQLVILDLVSDLSIGGAEDDHRHAIVDAGDLCPLHHVGRTARRQKGPTGGAGGGGLALDRMRVDPSYEHARRLHADEVERCRRMAAYAAELFEPGTRALTHCNAGGLATGGYGSAVGALLPRCTESRSSW